MNSGFDLMLKIQLSQSRTFSLFSFNIKKCKCPLLFVPGRFQCKFAVPVVFQEPGRPSVKRWQFAALIVFHVTLANMTLMSCYVIACKFLLEAMNGKKIYYHILQL